ncbi:MAG TPA: hypothetical protein VF457_05700, partial [Burkholderiaceae bacterium]
MVAMAGLAQGLEHEHASVMAMVTLAEDLEHEHVGVVAMVDLAQGLEHEHAGVATMARLVAGIDDTDVPAAWRSDPCSRGGCGSPAAGGPEISGQARPVQREHVGVPVLSRPSASVATAHRHDAGMLLLLRPSTGRKHASSSPDGRSPAAGWAGA